MNKTKIEWVKNPDGSQGYTSNPVRGECPVNCPYCYVRPFRNRYHWHKDIRFYPQELVAIRKRKTATGIFLGSTIELFHEETIGYMPEIMATIYACSQHRFYLLTKQPQNLSRFAPFPDNCFVGVTITNEATLLKATTNLGYIQAKVKFISFEPLLQRLPLPYYQLNCDGLIIGACTGTKAEMAELVRKYPDLTLMPYGKIWTAQPRIEDLGEIVEAADKAGIKVFLKDNLQSLLYGDALTGQAALDMGLLNWAGELRQEMPENRGKELE